MPAVVVAAAVVRDQGRILLTRRLEGSHLAGYWEFPGGKLEQGEPPEEACVRECREECGIEIDVRDILEVIFHQYADAERAAGASTKDVLLLFYDCRLAEGEVQHLGVAEHAWVTPEELRDYELPPADERLVDKLQSSR